MTTDREKLVVVQLPGGRQVLSRARLLVTSPGLSDPGDDDLTDVGREILRQAATVDGVEIPTVYRHGLLVRPVHPALWSWDEVEAGVFAAFAAVLGDVEVVREGC